MRILIIDDEPAVSGFFSQVAEMRGYETVDSVGLAEDAVTRVLRQRYDLITVDINLPGVSGLEIIALLRDMNPHAIICVISGFIPDEIPEEVRGCLDVLIEKPVSVDTFNELLDGAMRISETIEQIRAVGVDPVLVR